MRRDSRAIENRHTIGRMTKISHVYADSPENCCLPGNQADDRNYEEKSGAADDNESLCGPFTDGNGA